jgi:hypothetical protein
METKLKTNEAVVGEGSHICTYLSVVGNTVHHIIIIQHHPEDMEVVPACLFSRLACSPFIPHSAFVLSPCFPFSCDTETTAVSVPL